jgi:hypothetical protein
VAVAKRQNEELGGLPIDGAGASWRLWLGAVGLVSCLSIVALGFTDQRGELGIMGALGAVFISPLPGSCLLSGVGVKCGWGPDLLYRSLPLIVLGLFLMLAILGASL